MDVCERIRFWLHESGMTQKELANRSDITEAAISKYVRGEREPRSLTLSRIAAAFGVTVDDFLGTTHVGESDIEQAVYTLSRNCDRLTEEQRNRLIKALLDR